MKTLQICDFRRRTLLSFGLALFGWAGHLIQSEELKQGILPAADAPEPLSPIESLKQVQLPPGFEMSLVASEPLLQDPSGIAFDEWGRLFVCELHGYNIEGHLDVQALNQTGELDKEVRRIRWEFMGGKIAEEAAKLQFGVVKLLSDHDGDGLMDHAEVWADDLPPCYGLIAARGGVIAVCAPDIVFLADRDQDGRVDFRETLFTGFKVRTLERGINNPRLGVDNWIYVGGGGEGGTITGPHLAEPVVLGNTDFRIKADGSAIEPVTGRVGTFGMTLNEIGDRFPSSGGTPAIYALPIPFHYLQRNPFVASPGMNHRASDYNRGFRISEPHPWRVRRQQDPAWVKFYGSRETNSHYFSGGCSAEFYGGGSLPQEYAGNLFYCEPSLNIVHRTVLTRDGNGYQARRARGEETSEFLASTDQWFRPMSLRFGPDGGLYIVDMYREIIEDYSAIPRFLQQQYGLNRGSDRGRIWRLTPTQSSLPKKRFSDFAAADLTVSDWVAWTQDQEAWRRKTAQRLLVDGRHTAAAPALRAALRHDQSVSGCLSALYTLEGIGELNAQALRVALASRFYELRVHALRLAEAHLNHGGIQAQVAAMTGDSDSRVRLQVALSLGEADPRIATVALLELLRKHGEERWMTAAVLSSAREIAGPILLGLMRDPGVGVDSRDTVLSPLAATLVGSENFGELREVLRRAIGFGPRIQTSLLRGVVTGLKGHEKEKRDLDLMDILSEFTSSQSHEVVRLAVELMVSLPGEKPAALDEVFDRSLRTALNPEAEETERLQALGLLASAPFDLVDPLPAALMGAHESPRIQRAALLAVASHSESRAGRSILKEWNNYSPEIRAASLEAMFSRSDRVEALLSSIENGLVGLKDLSDRQRESLSSLEDPAMSARARELLRRGSAQDGNRLDLDRFYAALKELRNPDQGRIVFGQLCAPCHRAETQGHNVGPALGSVAGKPDEALLLDILDPNAKVDPEFRTYSIETQDGEIFSGILAADSPTSVTLREAQNLEHVVLRRNIKRLRSSELSLMPANFIDLLSPDDAAHLLAYLRVAYSK